MVIRTLIYYKSNHPIQRLSSSQRGVVVGRWWSTIIIKKTLERFRLGRRGSGDGEELLSYLMLFLVNHGRLLHQLIVLK